MTCCPNARPHPSGQLLSVVPVVYGDTPSPQGPVRSGPYHQVQGKALVLLLWGPCCLAPAAAWSCLSASCSQGPVLWPQLGPGCCNCPLTALLSSGHTASGWISHPTSDSEKEKEGLKWRSLGSRGPCCPRLGPGLMILTIPQTKAPASSPSHSASAASPGPGSPSTALALKME